MKGVHLDELRVSACILLHHAADILSSAYLPDKCITAPMTALIVADSVQKPRHTTTIRSMLSLGLVTEAVTDAGGGTATTVSTCGRLLVLQSQSTVSLLGSS